MTQDFTDMLVAAFETQTEDLEIEVKPVAFWQEILSGKAAMDATARALLMGSPLNRRMFEEAYQAERAALLDRVANLPQAPHLRRAASPARRQPIHIDGLSGLILEIQPLGDGWQIILDAAGLQLPVGAEVELYDDLGRVWISGAVPRDGVLDDFWSLPDGPQAVVAEGRAIGLRLDGLVLVPLTAIDGGTGDG
ncbi:hypothetical protein [Pacificoceanicola onchidii]|uniref:hypothetical protein n=1 Tax=Pacificoceanicola onchidii TaxID=2562685 RepID=UPI0010A68852|nr:hypothetical protein [Pacificoceanicola onchidii]